MALGVQESVTSGTNTTISHEPVADSPVGAAGGGIVVVVVVVVVDVDVVEPDDVARSVVVVAPQPFATPAAADAPPSEVEGTALPMTELVEVVDGESLPAELLLPAARATTTTLQEDAMAP